MQSIKRQTNSRDHPYDANGTGDGTRTYEWDGSNRLVAINDPGNGSRPEIAYDGDVLCEKGDANSSRVVLADHNSTGRREICEALR